jgi:hypothetical protein
MRNLTTASLSFAAGALSMFLLGNQASMTVQSASASSQGVTLAHIEDAKPVIPNVKLTTVGKTTFAAGGFVHEADGVNCVNCVFNGAKIRYSGGAFAFTNSTFEGKTNIVLDGAAHNTAMFLSGFGMLGCPASKPAPAGPKPPVLLLANMITIENAKLQAVSMVAPVGIKR